MRGSAFKSAARLTIVVQLIAPVRVIPRYCRCSRSAIAGVSEMLPQSLPHAAANCTEPESPDLAKRQVIPARDGAGPRRVEITSGHGMRPDFLGKLANCGSRRSYAAQGESSRVSPPRRIGNRGPTEVAG